MSSKKDFLSFFKSFGHKTFKGGIHPDYCKTSTEAKGIIDLEPADIMVYPVSQHLGAPAVPCVSVGDYVYFGQKIAEASGYVSANIHSSVSGKVIAIEKRLHSSGVNMDCIVIENDNKDALCPEIKENDWTKLSPRELIDIVKEAGVVGMGGATFPTHVKLSPPEDKRIEYVIINGAECEPYLTSDHRAMLETPEDLILGLKIMLKIFGLSTGYIGVEDNKSDAIKVLEECAKAEEDVKINIIKLKTKYPQGAEKQLIYAVSKRMVPKGKLPLDVGAVVNNIDTCTAIARAVRDGLPAIKRIVTISGDCIKESANFRIRIGTPVSYVIEKCGGFVTEPKKVIMGGPMMGVSIPNLDVPIIKGSSGIIAFSEQITDVIYKESPCLRCGKCVKVCPMNLLPNVLKLYADNDDFEALDKYNLSECIECGACSYICPAQQHPVQSIRTAKLKKAKLKA